MQAWDVSSSRVRADLATGTVPTITDGAAGAQGSTSGFHLTALAWGQVAVGKASKVRTGSRDSMCPKFLLESVPLMEPSLSVLLAPALLL